MRRGWLASLLLAVCLNPAPGAVAAEIYVTRGEFGEASFSDVVQPGATVIEVPEDENTPPVASDAWVDEALRVAQDLERSRLLREQEAARRAEERRRTAQAPSIPADVAPAEDGWRQSYWYAPPRYGDGGHWRSGGHRPEHGGRREHPGGERPDGPDRPQGPPRQEPLRAPLPADGGD
ncbi:MAG: hypothetical protein R3E86_13905 [Pseudomonadales bacterium]